MGNRYHLRSDTSVAKVGRAMRPTPSEAHSAAPIRTQARARAHQMVAQSPVGVGAGAVTVGVWGPFGLFWAILALFTLQFENRNRHRYCRP